MPERSRDGNRGHRRSPAQARGGAARKPGAGSTANRPKLPGALGVRNLGGDEFELVHPRCVHERELDYAEGIELLEAGDPESARDALRYALQGCGDNLWAHVALGKIALFEFKDPTLARGHFGYAFELVQRALPRGFAGRLPKHLAANRPLYDAIDGLAACYEALGKPAESVELRALAARWGAGSGPPPGT
jgi:hypothetical protein